MISPGAVTALCCCCCCVLLASGCSGDSGVSNRPVQPVVNKQVLAPLPRSEAKTYYVAPGGSDRGPGTLGNPWATIQKAADTLKPGEIALVRNGTYAENVVVARGGTAEEPMTISAYPGEQPVLHPAHEQPTYPLRFTTGAAYVRFSGFIIENAVGDSTMNVFFASASHDIELSGCEVRNARNSSGIFVDDTTSRIRLIGNRVHDNNEQGVQHQGIYFEGKHGLIANNIVYNHTNGFGIQVRSGANDVLVTGNTTSDNHLSGIMVENSAHNVLIVNNISAFNNGFAVRGLFGGGSIGRDNVAFGNLGYGNDDGQFANETAGVVNFEFGNLVGNPFFVDRASHDYELRVGSPAIDAATPRFALPVDAEGRPRNGPPDIGALERT